MKFSEMKPGVPQNGKAFLPYYSTLTADGTGDDRNRLTDIDLLPLSAAAVDALSKKVARPTGGSAGQVLAIGSDGSMTWATPETGGGTTPTPTPVYGLNPTPVVLTDAATVTPDASAGDFFSLTAANSRATRQIAKPTGVATGKAKQIILLFKQDGTGGRLLTFASGITAFGSVDLRANAVTKLVMYTVDGGTNWIVDGLGLDAGSNKMLGSDATGNPIALDNVRQAGIMAIGAPTNNKPLPVAIAPFPGRIRGLRSIIETGTITLSVGIDNTSVAGLTDITRDSDDPMININAGVASAVFTAGQVISVVPSATSSLTSVWGIYLDLVPSA